VHQILAKRRLIEDYAAGLAFSLHPQHPDESILPHVNSNRDFHLRKERKRLTNDEVHDEHRLDQPKNTQDTIEDDVLVGI
jgi:hypothetical protein